MGDPDQLFTYRVLKNPPPGGGGNKLKRDAVNVINAIDSKDIARVIVVVREDDQRSGMMGQKTKAARGKGTAKKR